MEQFEFSILPGINLRKIAVIGLLIIAVAASVILGVLFGGAKSDLAKSVADNASLESRINELSTAVSELQTELEQSQSDLSAASASDASNAALNEQLQQQIADLNKQIEILRQQISPNSTAAVGNTPTAAVPAIAPPDVPPVEGKVCYLTFDDGPSENTLRVLDILKAENVRATFFVVGTKKISYVQRIFAEGHTVALHTNSHDYATVYSSDEGFFADLQAISDKVHAEIGVRPNIIRFPGGSSNVISKKYNAGIMTRLTQSVEAKGYHYFDWNVSSGDATGKTVSAARIIENVKREAGSKQRICILMHDTDAKNTTVEALPGMIAYLRSQGYSFEAITESTVPFHHTVAN